MMISALHSVTVFAQKRTISGTVVDERNEPLIGATIVAEGKSGMTITNVDGKFTLAVLIKLRQLRCLIWDMLHRLFLLKERVFLPSG